MKRNVLTMIATAAAAMALMPAAAEAEAGRRNIVLFISDDHGMEVGAYGDEVAQTPHMDRLAEEGTRFDFAFATTASCSASRSVVLTGLHNHANGQYGHIHAYHHFKTFDHVHSLPVLLSEHAGYRTARIGKFHVAPEEVYQFDHALPGPNRNPVRMAENVRAFIEDEEDDRPFFLLFATSDPHRGGGFAEDLEHAPDRFGNRDDGYPGVERILTDPDDVIVPPFLPDTPVTRAELAQYYESVNRVDQGLGKLIEVLEEAGVYDETLVIYTSDHGMAFAGAKTTVYEPGLHVPLIVRNPHVSDPPSTTRAMVNFADITPTLLDFAEADLPDDVAFHGRSFMDAMTDADPEGFDTVYASHTFHEVTMYYPMRVVRDRRYKLIWNIAHGLEYPSASDLWASPTWQQKYQQGMDARYGPRTVGEYLHRPEFELFDLESDPYEANNLADDPDHAERLEQMKQRLRAFQQRTDDPWILKWEYE